MKPMWIVGAYLAGVVIGLIATQGSAATRVGLALVWPLGPLAFVVTSAGLLVIAGVAFPIVGAILAAAIAAGWWLLR